MTARLLTVLAILLASTTTTMSAMSDIAEIDGVHVDFHLIRKQQRNKITPSVVKQIEIVKTANLPPRVVEFVETVLIVIDPAMLTLDTPGQYMSHHHPPYVRIKPIELPEDHPIVLHELMHAYQYQVLKQVTPEIASAYRRAQLAGVYPAEYRGAAFLYNADEYFANMATTFLHGKIARPPYNCFNIIAAQPKFVDYLTSLFGPHPCS